ncbi:4-aminobutyrate--2-oxoglutarate transaminase [Nitratidesulfovibrio termitidis]|uniref:4-aminobutyrate--2-oxoglutarate transaminase n=1 Tax=Nitratidesulfovibrio termitidis TaxID=42252 RepID=UPI0003F72DA9|nr:4-aminobutyrate--2-oxoglutarate transaminase [Nitratidesulfovibrio termitidis]
MNQQTKDLMDRRAKSVAKGVFNAAPVFAAKAEGAVITDVEGREFIDFAGGIGVMNVGHNHPKVVEAIKRQADKLLHSCFHIVMYEEYVALCEKLAALTPGSFPKKAALFNSGAEAVENAVKIARHATGRQGVVVFENSFHGRTLLAMSLTSKVKPYKFGFGPYAPEIYRIPYAYCYRCPMGKEYPSCDVACADLLRKAFVNSFAPENIACLLVEPIVGEGGFATPPPEYFARLKAICEEFGIVFIADEVQTGAARTGRMFAMEHWGVEPDLVCMAKSIGGGMPISAVAGKAELMDSPQVGGLGGTYGGNPVCCAAALAALEAIEADGLVARSEALGTKLFAAFGEMQKKYAIIGDVRGKGSMIALELVHDRTARTPAADKAKALTAYCFEKGLILLSCGNYGNVIRTLMPLAITDAQLDKAMAIIDEGFAAIA